MGKSRGIFLFLFGLFWLVSVAFGVAGLGFYSQAAGKSEVAPATWPLASTLPRAEDANTLLMFLHPECSCSQASIEELSKILVFAPPELRTVAVFIRPTGWTDAQLHGSLWKRASAIPGVVAVVAEGSGEANLFGAHTSGHTALYDRLGRLQFSGGVTGARGHSGDNVGQSSVVRAIQGHPEFEPVTDVFGCGLFDDATYSKITRWASFLMKGRGT